MTKAGDNGKRFEVHCSPVVARSLRQLQHQASESGRGAAVVEAFREIVRRLRHDPFHTGEPLYRLPALRMQLRCCVIRPLVVDFAVCEDKPLVFIKGAKLLST